MGKVLERVWKSDSVKGTIKFVLVAIAEHADDKGECFPSLRLIASKTGYSVRHCQRLIDQLANLGEIEIIGGGGRKSNLYRFPKYMVDNETTIQKCHVTHDTNVTPDISKTPMTHDTNVTPDLVECHLTHDNSVTPPMTTVSTELKYNNNINPLKDKSIKSIVAPDGDDTTQKSLPPTPTNPSEGKESDVPRVVASSTIEGMPSSQSSPQAESVPVSNSQIQPPPVAPPRDMRPLSDQQRMMSAIVAAFGWNFKTMTTGNKSLVGKIAKELLDATATPDQIPDLYAFCKSKNWSGGFTPGALSSQWANFCANQDSSGEIFPDWTPPPGYVGVKFNYPPPLAETIADDENDPYIGLTTAEMREKFNQIMTKMVANMTIEETPIPDDDPLKEVLLW